MFRRFLGVATEELTARMEGRLMLLPLLNKSFGLFHFLYDIPPPKKNLPANKNNSLSIFHYYPNLLALPILQIQNTVWICKIQNYNLPAEYSFIVVLMSHAVNLPSGRVVGWDFGSVSIFLERSVPKKATVYFCLEEDNANTE